MRSIQDQVNKTYFSLRWAAAIIGYAFPIVLVAGGYLGGFSIRDSMSAYYHAYHRSATDYSLVASDKTWNELTPAQQAAVPEAGTMRDEFVGLLFAIGAVLYVNKGHSNKENVLLNLAGVFSCGIALFPMPWKYQPTLPVSPHGTFAILFFLTIASILIFCSKDTVEFLPEDRKKFYYVCYYSLASVMVVSPLAVWGVHKLHAQWNSYIFWVEFLGIYAFGTYWIVKTREIGEIQAYQARTTPPSSGKGYLSSEAHDHADQEAVFF